MKDQIDQLLASVAHDLAGAPTEIPALALFNADGYSRALRKLAVLMRWAEDPTLAPEIRVYLQGRLDALDFPNGNQQ